SFFFNAHIDFFEEISKYRAARRIWARHLRDRYGARDEKSLLLRFHTQTAGCSLTAQQPENNVVRTTIEALAAVLGGTQSLHTNALDEAYALPSEKNAKTALRTQQIIAHESGVTNTVDPLGGSYFIESLTDAMEQAAESYFEKIADMGGMVKAIEAGYPQREIVGASSKFQSAIENNDETVIGVNAFAEPMESEIDTLKIDPVVEQTQKENLFRIKGQRNQPDVEMALKALGSAISEGHNSMPPILDAVRVYATVGEIVSVLQSVYGTYEESPIF
ncbi:MAG: methylmalonyl-CoA mutase, partial [Candidatus Latescibacteria bacterium]|nr:methylmalonyl-CoA mutase [Candidatus Latescibacterota bacterium]